jgi:NAD(P)-dependent dehydrogenase (short-subunit alcohol dehydrogenase family)
MLFSVLFSLYNHVYYFISFLHSQFFVTPPYPTIRWKGKTVIVTGASSGLGLEAARHFVRLGAEKVILAVRNLENGERAKVSIEGSCGRSNVLEVRHLDLASYRSVKQFAQRAHETLERLDALVANAAVATPSFRLVEGNEMTITTNVISTFLLALLLVPLMKDTAKNTATHPHIAFVGSEVIFHTSFPERHASNIFNKLNERASARMLDRYNVSKLMLAMICREIYSYHYDNYPVVINYLNPGLCHSQLLREMSIPAYLVKLFLARTAEVGSRTLVHAASAGPGSHGQYLSDCRIEDPPAFVLRKEGVETQERVWMELSKKLEAVQPGILENLS